MPTAACSFATSTCRTSATYAVAVPRPGGTIGGGDPRPRRVPARHHPRQPDDVPAVRARRDRLEPAGRRLRGDRPAWEAEILATDEHLAPDGRVMEVLSEHLCEGWLEGYLLTGRHGLFNCYEAFIHIIDSMFNQHAKWLKTTRDIPWRRPDRVAQLPALEPRLAPGPQRLQPPGPGLHRSRGQQEGRRHPGVPAARRELPALGGRPLPPLPRLRERHRRRQAAGAAVAVDGRRRSCTAPAASASGSGRATRRRATGRRDGLRRRHPDARDAGRGRHPAASSCPTSGSESSTSST